MKSIQKNLVVPILLICVTTLIVVCICPHKGFAAQKKKMLSLSETNLTVKSGESKKLKVTARPYKKDAVIECYWWAEHESIAQVDDDGNVTGLLPGTTVITYVECASTEEGAITTTVECKITVLTGQYTLENHELRIAMNESITMQLPTGVNANYDTSYAEFPIGAVHICTDGADFNQMNLTATLVGETYLNVWFYDANGLFLCGDRCLITVVPRGIDERKLTIAKGLNHTFQVNGYQESQMIAWTSLDPNVAIVDSFGRCTAMNEGSTVITLVVINENGEQEEYTCSVKVSYPTLLEKSQNLAVGCSDTIQVTGILDCSKIVAESSNPEVVKADGTNLHALSKGKATIVLQIDGIQLTYKVKVTDPTVNHQMIVLKKGDSSLIRVNGINSNSKINYVSSDSKIVKVNQIGTVKAVKEGTATIRISVDGKEILVPVSISNALVVQALNYAMTAIGSTYSQEKRMSNRFYDCSSLAWRSYHTANINFGNDTYAPTAAGIAEYLVNNKKAIAYKEIALDQLQPGDLVFFASGNNGRYKNIYHVAIYAGTKTQNDEWDEPYEQGLFIEARGDGVGLFPYVEGGRNVVVVARPTK